MSSIHEPKPSFLGVFPSLISHMVSVDVRRHVYLLFLKCLVTVCGRGGGEEVGGSRCLIFAVLDPDLLSEVYSLTVVSNAARVFFRVSLAF